MNVHLETELRSFIPGKLGNRNVNQCPKFLRQTFVEWKWRLDPKVLLGGHLLRAAAPERQIAQRGRAWPGLQMDQNPLSVLANANPLR